MVVEEVSQEEVWEEFLVVDNTLLLQKLQNMVLEVRLEQLVWEVEALVDQGESREEVLEEEVSQVEAWVVDNTLQLPKPLNMEVVDSWELEDWEEVLESQVEVWVEDSTLLQPRLPNMVQVDSLEQEDWEEALEGQEVSRAVSQVEVWEVDNTLLLPKLLNTEFQGELVLFQGDQFQQEIHLFLAMDHLEPNHQSMVWVQVLSLEELDKCCLALAMAVLEQGPEADPMEGDNILLLQKLLNMV